MLSSTSSSTLLSAISLLLLHFLLASLSLLSSEGKQKIKIKWHMHLHSLFLHPFLHLQMRRGTNASFPSRCIWHGDSPSSAEQNDSTLLSLCQRGCCYLPRRWKWGIFTFVGEDRRTGNKPMGIMHWSSTFFFSFFFFRSCDLVLDHKEEGESSQGLAYV